MIKYVYNNKKGDVMSGSAVSKGYISFRASAQSLAFVLVRYGDKNQTLRSYRYGKLAESASEISALLSNYSGAEERWVYFSKNKLQRVITRYEEKRRLLTYDNISKMLDEIEWSIERYKRLDKTGSKGGKELAVKFWRAWQSIRPVINSSTYWAVKEEDALISLGLKAKNSNNASMALKPNK